MNAAARPLLTVHHLITQFATPGGPVYPVNDVSFSLERGKTLGLVGESGSGKSLTALSILRLVPSPGKISNGEISYSPGSATPDSINLLNLGPVELRRIRGKEISMIFQEPMTALNPVFSVGNQICEALQAHEEISSREAKARALEIMRALAIPSPEHRFGDYPHQLSGGLRQRVMIAMSLVTNPRLLIADEPTTALDVTIQAQILDLLLDLKERLHLSMIFISHDLGVIAHVADFAAVMYAGRIIEYGPTAEVLTHPMHPYTAGLIRSLPRTGQDTTAKHRLASIPGSVPNLLKLPAGCPFQPRCPEQLGERCTTIPIPLLHPVPGREVRCVKFE
ncbi:MAG: ABC transporter ATP-binding protein [Terriglobia bacterium]